MDFKMKAKYVNEKDKLALLRHYKGQVLTRWN